MTSVYDTFDIVVWEQAAPGRVGPAACVKGTWATLVAFGGRPLDDNMIFDPQARAPQKSCSANRPTSSATLDAQPRSRGAPATSGKGTSLAGSSVNAMTYARGSKADYDRWHTIWNAGWGWTTWSPTSAAGRERQVENAATAETGS